MKNKLDKIIYIIRKVPVWKRMMFGFCTVSIIPFLLLGIISYSISSRAIVEKISQSNMQNLSMAKINIINMLERLESNCIEIAFSQTAQTVLKNYNNLSDFDKFQATQSLQGDIAKQFTLTNFVSDVILVTNDLDTLIAYGGRNKNINLEAEYLKTIAQKVRKAEGKTVFSIIDKDNSKGILMSRKVNDFDSGEALGYLLLCFDEVYLQNICEMTTANSEAFALIVDNNNVIITSNHASFPSNTSFPYPQLTNELFLNTKIKGTMDYDIENDKFLITYNELLTGKWHLLMFTPYSYLNKENAFFAQVVVFLLFLFGGFSILTAAIISKSIDKPLKTTLRLISDVSNGILIPNYQDSGEDEIAYVNANFNIMIQTLSTSLESIKKTEREKRDLEFKTLMAQINPHFLSNTLSSVKWMAEIQGAENIANLTEALIKILQSTFSKRELIPLKEELSLLKDYITIQSYRYMDKFSVSYQISETTVECLIPAFTLQPLLENAIIHGISPKKGEGTIQIEAEILDECLIIKIIDNGIGMNEKQLYNLLHEDVEKNRQHFTNIGVKNTNDRIQLLFGYHFGLHITSRESEETIVTILLPKLASEREDSGCIMY